MQWSLGQTVPARAGNPTADRYDLSNIYRVWIPTRDRVIRTRDVIFKWQFSYKNDILDKITADKITEQEVETLDLE
jgi:hypothetical protein